MPAAGHLCQFVTIGDGSTEITLVKLNNGAAMPRPADTAGRGRDRERERESAEDSGIIKMQRGAVPCGSVLGPKHWPKMLKATRTSLETRKTFSGLASRAELLNRIKISWCIFTDCNFGSCGQRIATGNGSGSGNGNGNGNRTKHEGRRMKDPPRAVWLPCAQLAAVSSILC